MQGSQDKLITVAEARELLDISRARMSEILADGTLKWQPSPLDRRVKLVLLSDVIDLAQRSGKEIRSQG